MVSFISKNKILPRQHEIQQNRSTETGSTVVIQYVFNKLDAGEMVVTITFELREHKNIWIHSCATNFSVSKKFSFRYF